MQNTQLKEREGLIIWKEATSIITMQWLLGREHKQGLEKLKATDSSFESETG